MDHFIRAQDSTFFWNKHSSKRGLIKLHFAFIFSSKTDRDLNVSNIRVINCLLKNHIKV